MNKWKLKRRRELDKIIRSSSSEISDLERKQATGDRSPSTASKLRRAIYRRSEAQQELRRLRGL